MRFGNWLAQFIKRVASLVRAWLLLAPNNTTTAGRELFNVVCITTQRPASLINPVLEILIFQPPLRTNALVLFDFRTR